MHQITADGLMHLAGIVPERGNRIDGGGQRFIVDFDPLQRVLGDVAVDGGHQYDRFADIAHLVHRDRKIVDRRAHRARQRVKLRDEFGARQDAVDAVQRQGSRNIDTLDARMGIRRTQDRHMPDTGYRRQIVDEARMTRQQRCVFQTRHRLPHPTIARPIHAASLCDIRRESAKRQASRCVNAAPGPTFDTETSSKHS